MLTMGQIEQYRETIVAIASSHGARNVRVFGSVARNQADSHSDLDVLVQMDRGRSLLDRIALMQELEDLLKVPVDVVNEKAMPGAIRLQVEKEARPL